MKMFVLRVLAAVSCVILLTGAPVVGLAQDNVVSLFLAGEAYDGPPHFKVTLDDKIIGEGDVDKSIDTITQGRLIVDGVKRGQPENYTERYTFTVEASQFDSHAALRIRMTNDKFDDVNKIGDRNLYVISANINGHEISASDFFHRGGDNLSELPLVANMVALFRDEDVAIAEPPAEGWPAPAEQGSVSSTVNDAANNEKLSHPLPPITSAAPKTQASASKALSPNCAVNFDLTVGGFAQNVTQLTAGQVKPLKALVRKLKGQNCKVLVTGYSDNSGSREASGIKAHDRAAAVLKFITKEGAHFKQSDLVSFGATSQFGSTMADNRLVLVHVGP